MRTGRSRIRILAGASDFLFTKAFRRSLLISGHEGPHPGDKRTGLTADHLFLVQCLGYE